MLTTSEILARVRSCTEAQLREINAATGLPMPTLTKLRYGVTDDPRVSTVDKLRAYFDPLATATQHQKAGRDGAADEPEATRPGGPVPAQAAAAVKEAA